MKKTWHILLICLLCVLVYAEIKNDTSSEDVVPTARFVSKLKKENEASEKIAYLTFDDGPSENTKRVLDILKEQNVVATFFLVGSEIEKERENIVKDIINQGSAVGVHTYYHDEKIIYKNKKSFFMDYNKTSKIIEKITGEIPVLHRFPWGSNNGYVSPYVDSVHKQLSAMGIRSFDWNVSGEDSVSRNVPPKTIYNNVKKDLTRFTKPIILLHDSATMENTVDTLEDIITYIKEQGYEFDTLEHRDEYMFPASWR